MTNQTTKEMNASNEADEGYVPRRIREEGSDAAIQLHYPTQWPPLGGRNLVQLPDDAFEQPDFASVYAPGLVAYVYVGATNNVLASPEHPDGLKGLAKELALPIFKISATGSDDARERLLDLNLEHYGSIHETEDGHACGLGFKYWRTQTIHPSRGPKSGAPITIGPRTIRVVLPKHLSLTAFEKRLADMMRPSQLARWIQSPIGREHCRKVGCDYRLGVRRSTYNFGNADRYSRAAELYIFRPRGDDASRLVTICENIVYEFATKAVNGQLHMPWAWVSGDQGYSARS